MVTNGVTALEMLRRAEGGEEQFDLVITDVHMPGMDGFKLLEIIGLEMDLPVISTIKTLSACSIQLLNLPARVSYILAVCLVDIC